MGRLKTRMIHSKDYAFDKSLNLNDLRKPEEITHDKKLIQFWQNRLLGKFSLNGRGRSGKCAIKVGGTFGELRRLTSQFKVDGKQIIP